MRDVSVANMGLDELVDLASRVAIEAVLTLTHSIGRNSLFLHGLAPGQKDCTSRSEEQRLADGAPKVDILVYFSPTIGNMMWDGCSLSW